MALVHWRFLTIQQCKVKFLCLTLRFLRIGEYSGIFYELQTQVKDY